MNFEQLKNQIYFRILPDIQGTIHHATDVAQLEVAALGLVKSLTLLLFPTDKIKVLASCLIPDDQLLLYQNKQLTEDLQATFTSAATLFATQINQEKVLDDQIFKLRQHIHNHKDLFNKEKHPQQKRNKLQSEYIQICDQDITALQDLKAKNV